MIEEIIKKIFGDPSEKKIKQLTKVLDKIKEFEEKQKDFSLDDVKNKTADFKALFEGLDINSKEDSKKIREILEEIKAEAFALVKTTAKLLNGKEFELRDGRTMTWNMVHYDVQFIGWLAIHEWAIAEMKTWEWKTLVATLPAYLNALTWNSVHVVTVNDYLAKRDWAEMWILYEALGLTSGVIYGNQPRWEKENAYSCDIVYATNNELGFDYLRDNMVISKEDKFQKKLFFAIIDEVDSILIDEARTPLIISMPDSEPTSKYMQFAALANHLQKWTHYKLDEKQKTATLTEEGIAKIEELLRIDNIYISEHYNDIHHIENALKAMAAYQKDKDYLVIDWEVQIIDEHTWRVLAWRRYSDWLHQAIEAKEWVEIKQESKTLASITFQNFFRMYWKLAWMTWTAKTEEEEFYKVYGLETLIIPTNKPIARVDKKDMLFKNEKGKFDYVVKLIKEIAETGQPILVWTVSVEKSEYLSSLLKKENIPHNVLNAKNHAMEAEIVAAAGQKWAITIATNMAWRWTDIKLWKWVRELWGLCIIGTEKHETRRIDNQLRWRAWRQWDPGSTQFLISPNDDIMRIFGWDKLFSIFNSPMFASLPDDEPLQESSMLTKKITSVQKQVEGHNFDIRKHILEYDDVINKHRNIIYWKRNKILDNENIHEDLKKMILNQINILVVNQSKSEDFNPVELTKAVNSFLGIQAINTKVEFDDVSAIKDISELSEYIWNIALEELEKMKTNAISEESFYDLERRIVLNSIDELWMRHIDSMSKLRESVAFEWYAQRNPLVVYKERSFEKFEELNKEIEFRVVKTIFSLRPNEEVEVKEDFWDLTVESVETPEITLENISNMMKEMMENQKTEENNETEVKKIRI